MNKESSGIPSSQTRAVKLQGEEPALPLKPVDPRVRQSLSPDIPSTPEIKEGEKKIIKLNTPAFILELPTPKTPEDYAQIINDLRGLGMPAYDADEGMAIAGYFDGPDKIPLLQEYGRVSVGVPGDGAPSLLVPERQSISGLPISAAARGAKDEGGIAWQITHEADVDARSGYKNTTIKEVPLSELKTQPLRTVTPPEVYEPIDISKIEKVRIEDGFAFKVDVNGSVTAFNGADEEGQEGLVHEYSRELDDIESHMMKVAEDNAVLGPRTTESTIIYAKNKSVIADLEQALRKVGISIKTVGVELKGATLSTINGRAFHSDSPLDHEVWSRLEAQVKGMLEGATEEEQVEIESRVFMGVPVGAG